MKSAKATHSRTSSDLTERRFNGDWNCTHTQKMEEEIVSRNIEILQEKQRLFEIKETELRRIKEKLEEKLTKITYEEEKIDRKIREKNRRKEELSGLIEVQSIKKEGAVRELSLKEQQVRLVRACSPSSHSRHRQRKMSPGETELKPFKAALTKAQEDLLKRQQEVLAKAKEVKGKQRALQEVQERYRQLEATNSDLKTALAASMQANQALDEVCKTSTEDILSLVKAAAHTRSLLSLSEQYRLRSLAIQQKREKVQQLKSHLNTQKTRVTEDETRLSLLEFSGDEMERRVLTVLTKDTEWKSLHFHDMRQILTAIQRISDKEARLKSHVSNRLSL